MLSPFCSLSPCTHTTATRPPKLFPAFLDSHNKSVHKFHSLRSSQHVGKRITPLHLLVKRFLVKPFATCCSQKRSAHRQSAAYSSIRYPQMCIAHSSKRQAWGKVMSGMGYSSVPHWSQHHAQSMWQGVEPPEEPIDMRRSQQQTQASSTRISVGQPPTASVVDVA